MKIKIIAFFLAALMGCSEGNENISASENINGKILEILEEYSDEVRLSHAISLPIVLSSNSEFISLYDYADSEAKVLSRDLDVFSFNPLGYGDDRLGGAYFKSLGYSSTSEDNLLVGSESIIKEYDMRNKSFGITIDSFSECSSFNSQFSHIFDFNRGGVRYVVSQNGVPCINALRDGESFSKNEFQSLQFLRITNVKTRESNNSFSIPASNEILAENKLHVKTYPLVTVDNLSGDFFAMINPTNQLIKMHFSPKELVFKTEKTWNLALPFFYNHVEYTLNNGIDRELSARNYKNNPELKLVKVHGDTVAVLYRPGFEESEYKDSPYTSHYFIYILDMASGSSVTYALNYKKIIFLNYLDSGSVWFYDVEKSEMSSKAETVIRSIEVSRLFE